MLRRVAERVLEDFPQPPDFNWGEGVLMVGMTRAGRALPDERCLTFVGDWADHWHATGLKRVLEQRGYCGRWGPGFALLELHRITPEDRTLALAHEVAAYLLSHGTRARGGGFGHWRDNRQLWVDTLYMVCPLLAELGEVMDRDEFKTEAARQLLIFSSHLQDQQTGLFYHMMDIPEARRTGEFWGRGNGWAAMSFVEVLARLDRRHPMARELTERYRHLAGGLLATRDSDTGLWHTVLDRPDSYVETSASAMILYSLLRGERLGLTDPIDPSWVRESWAAIAAQVDEKGRVINVSAGTGPTDYPTYATIERGTFTWGTGAFLILAAELADPPR